MAYVIAQWVSALRSERREFHKPVFVLFGFTGPNPRGTAPGESGDRASGVSAKVKAPRPAFQPAESALRRRIT